MISWRSATSKKANDDQASTVHQRSPLEADDEPDTNCQLPDADESNTSKGPQPRHGRLEETPSVDGDCDQTTSTTVRKNKRTRASDPVQSKVATSAAHKSANHSPADDEGGDHACDGKSSVNWKPQNVQSTCEFIHSIKDYASKRESGCKKAEYSEITVDEHGNKWRLIIYVNGNGRASNHHLSLFLQVADAEDLPFGWKKAVSYVLTLEHPDNPSLNYAKRNPDKTFKLCPKAIDWGWSQFITSDRIQQEGFVVNDSLTVRASVSVKSSSISIDEEDAELYLKCAVEEGKADAVKRCLEQGASVNCQFKDDMYTPLHTACSSGTNKGSLEVLNLLLKEGADGNACNKWRETPLLIAANNGHLAAVDALVKHGADPSLCSEAGWSALTFAGHKGYDDIVALLLRAGAPVNTRVAEDNSTPLHKACAGSKPGHLGAVKLLLGGGADVHALNKWRETPLLTAANHGQAGAVEALLKAGADPCKCTDTGWSPLSIAAYKGHNEVVRLLLDVGAPTEEGDPTLSALLQAATKGLPATVELLLQHGADHTVTTKKGDTALSILVEQNMIDTAVEMVTEYSASIPRCSRDRKKIQRARLLINLRMKQMEKDGRKFAREDDNGDDETDDDDDSVSRTAQHEDLVGADGGRRGGTSRKSRDKVPKEAAEEMARIAEEALLQELEQEEQRAKEDEKEANSKRDKKRKKKEKERQQKLKEEEDRREQEAREAEERERSRKAKEEKHRMEQEAKLKEHREREAREAFEREKVLVAKRKERERRDREAQSKDKSVSLSAASSPTATNPTVKAPKAVKNGKLHSPSPHMKSSGEKKGNSTIQKVTLPAGRRWETKPVSQHDNGAEQSTLRASFGGQNSTFLLAPRHDSVPLNGEPVMSKEANAASAKTLPTAQLGAASQQPYDGVEHPAIALFRREKVVELIERCNPLVSTVGEHTVKRVIYRWVARAAHEASQFIDALIPSWRDVESLVGYFQRQFISESRRMGTIASIERLKDTGASVANLCVSLAREVDQLRQRFAGQIQTDFSDGALGMTAVEAVHNLDSCFAIGWANRTSVKIPSRLLSILRGRYVGPRNQFLTAVFVAKMWHETLALVVEGTSLDIGLTTTVQGILLSEAGVAGQMWSDPFVVFERNAFWSKLDGVDRMFGGKAPFAKDAASRGQDLAAHGGSFSVIPPLDSILAVRYVQIMIDQLEAASTSNVPLSFILFLPADCFPPNHNGPALGDIKLLDPRMDDPQRSFVQRVERLGPGQHFYELVGNGSRSISQSGSLLLILQNQAGAARFAYSNATVSRIMSSLSTASPPPRMDNRMVSPLVFASDPYPQPRESPRTPSAGYFEIVEPMSPKSQQRTRSADFGPISGRAIGNSFSPANEVTARASRHGRLFDLVDDIEEDQANDVDIVSGMLNDLDMGFFRGTGVGSEVDIEAISLMGLGGGKAPAHNQTPPFPASFR